MNFLAPGGSDAYAEKRCTGFGGSQGRSVGDRFDTKDERTVKWWENTIAEAFFRRQG